MTPLRRTTAVTATAVALATAGGLLAVTATPAAAAVTCASPVFKRQFFGNTSFSGTPKKTDCDSAIDQNWGTGAPAAGLPTNNFGVRWTVTRDFGSGGPFTFTAAAQDGIRVHLDGTRKIDLWKNVSTTQKKTLNLTIPPGKHTLRVDFVNWTGSANVKFAYTPRTSTDVDKVEPLAPTGAALTYDKATGKAKVTWSKNKEMDLAGYRVYRRPSDGSFGSKALTTTTAATTSYTDSPPPTGQAFSYEVRAYDKAGNTSTGSADQAVTTVDRTPPAAPFLEMDACPDNQPYSAPELVTTSANRADIAWYELQRLDSGTWKTVYTGAKGAACDTGHPADGSEVTYRGRARDAAGNWSTYSAATKFTTFDMTPPAPAADARLEYRSGVPHLLWSPVDGAASYQVLQYDPATGGWLDALRGDTSTTTTPTTTTATDVVPRQRLATADTYRYAVRSVDAKGNAAAPVETTLTMADRPESIPSFKTTATNYGKGVSVAWSSADPWAFDMDGPKPTFRIVRTDRATGESTVVSGCKPDSSQDLPLTDPQTYWTASSDMPEYATGFRHIAGVCRDVSGASETTYDYTVVTIDPYGRESLPGPAATATTPDTERPAPVEGLTAEVVPLGVRLTWTPHTDDDVIGYHVWQGTTDPDTGETVWVKNCWTGDSLAETEKLCPTVPDGATHVYRVAAQERVYDEGPDFFNTADISVTLPDTRPPGWTGTGVLEDSYPSLYVDCSESSGLGDCARFTGYRVERWDPASAAYVTLAEGTAGDATSYTDTTVHEDELGLYYYRVVRLDATGAEAAITSRAFGVWESWF